MPLHWAVVNGHDGCFDLLLRRMRRPVGEGEKLRRNQHAQQKITSLPAETCLEIAVRLGRRRMAIALLEAGAGDGYSGDARGRAMAWLDATAAA